MAIGAGLFKDFNKPFGGPTGFEWLSRDTMTLGHCFSESPSRSHLAALPPGRRSASVRRRRPNPGSISGESSASNIDQLCKRKGFP